jgi:hypothetical protein
MRGMLKVAAAGLVVASIATSALAQAQASTYPDRAIGQDWCTAGFDCTLFTAGDIDGDGHAEVITLNGARDLCAAPTVKGWKASTWIAIRSDLPSDVTQLLAVDVDPAMKGTEALLLTPGSLIICSKFENDRYQEARTINPEQGTTFTEVHASEGIVLTDSKGNFWRVAGERLEKTTQRGAESSAESPPIDPPPYEPEAPLLLTFRGDFSGDGIPDNAAVFTAHKPSQHRMVRIALTPNLSNGDRDQDGLSDAEEAKIGTNPLDRDTDMDGLLDGWEVHGLPRDIKLGDRISHFNPAEPGKDNALNPLRQDVILVLSYFDGVDATHMENELPQVQRLYRELSNTNPNGTKGVWVHFRVEPTLVTKADQAMPWWDVGNKYFAAHERGFMHWLQIAPGGGGQSGQTADMGGAGSGWAVIAHEFGHQMSLSHEGDSEAAWCPLYPSLMNYAFSYSLDGDGNKIKFSSGEFRETVLDETKLVEKLPYPYEHVKYLANWPFRYSIKDNGDGSTLIDWNHSGSFDEGTVEADVNYGGSTHGGTRRNHETTGSGPSLAYVGDTLYLLAVDITKDHMWLKSYKGNEEWAEKRVMPTSATEREPIMLGGTDHGLIFHHHIWGWHVTKFDGTSFGTPAKLADVPTSELSAVRVGDRVLLVSRGDDNILEYRWLSFTGDDFSKPVTSAPQRFETRSLVAPGLAVDPKDGRVLMVTSMTNSHGSQFAMRVTWMVPRGDRLWEQETRWTRGEGSGNGCCTKPVVAFSPGGQLTIFHQGGADLSGQMIAYRTTKVGNQGLDEGWLTCMMYDVWTRSRVPVAFAVGPQGAVYSYRWDAGGTNNMLQTAHNGLGIDTVPMRDFNDGEKIAMWGIRHSILNIRR